jgi:hypothetical protein
MAGGTLMSRLVSHAAFFCLFFFSPQNILVREPEANTKKKKKKKKKTQILVGDNTGCLS